MTRNSLLLTACVLFIFMLTIILILDSSSLRPAGNYYDRGYIVDDKDYLDLIKPGMTCEEIEHILPKQNSRSAGNAFHNSVYYWDSGVIVGYAYRDHVSLAVTVDFVKRRGTEH